MPTAMTNNYGMAAAWLTTILSTAVLLGGALNPDDNLSDWLFVAAFYLALLSLVGTILVREKMSPADRQASSGVLVLVIDLVIIARVMLAPAVQ